MRSIKHLEAARVRLIRDMERFCLRHRISETTFGKLAVRDGKFAARLRGGENLTLRTMTRADEFISGGAHPAGQPSRCAGCADG